MAEGSPGQSMVLPNETGEGKSLDGSLLQSAGNIHDGTRSSGGEVDDIMSDTASVSDAGADVMEEEEVSEYEESVSEDIPRVEFVPRAKSPKIGDRHTYTRPSDERARGSRAASITASKEELKVQEVRSRINLAMVDVVFPEKASAVPEDMSHMATRTKHSDALSKLETERLKDEFALYLNEGKEFTKQTLINRLEVELQEVERELAQIDLIKQREHFLQQRQRPATAQPRRRMHGQAKPRTVVGRPATAGRARVAQRSTMSSSQGFRQERRSNAAVRPMTASRSRSRSTTGNRPIKPLDADDEERYAEEKTNLGLEAQNIPDLRQRKMSSRPRTAGVRNKNKDSGNKTLRPSTAGPSGRWNRNQPKNSPFRNNMQRGMGVTGPIAGYVPTKLKYTDDTIALARSLSKADIEGLLDKPTIKEACFHIGVKPSHLLPKPVKAFTKITSGFQKLTIGRTEAYKRWSIHDEQRQKWLAAVLLRRDKLKEKGKSHSGNQSGLPNVKQLAAEAVAKEIERKKVMKRRRQKSIRAKLRENEAIVRERKEWFAAQAEKEKRTEKARAQLALTAKVQAERAAKRAKEIQKIREEKLRMDEERLRQGAERQKKLKERQLAMERRRAANKKKKAAEALRKEKYRKRVREERQASQRLRAEAARAKMAIKDGHVRRLQERRAAELEKKKKESIFKAKTLHERRQRIKRQQNFHRRQLARKTQLQSERQKEVEQLKSAILSERRAIAKQNIIEKVSRLTFHVHEVAYHANTTLTPQYFASLLTELIYIDSINCRCQHLQKEIAPPDLQLIHFHLL